MKFWNQKWLWTGILFAAATILYTVKLVVLPQGGAVTCFSLLMLWLMSYFFGFKHGLLCSVVYGCTKLFFTYVTGEYVNFEPMAILLEYPLAHGIFCLGALLDGAGAEELGSARNSEVFRKEAHKLRAGYLIGVFGQLVLYVVSAVLFYPPDRQGFLANLGYCIVYDGSYLLVEGGITFLVLCIPAVAEAVIYLKYVANNEEPDDTYECF